MTRLEHNAAWHATRQPTDQVCCNLFGYGEISQYDARCAACWLGTSHTWEKHDSYIREGQRQVDDFMACHPAD